MSDKDKYWVAFSSIEKIDSRFVLALFEHYGDIEKAWNSNDLSFMEGLTEDKKYQFLKLRDKTNLEKAINYVEERDLSYVTYEDSKYPKLLKRIYNPPSIFYYKGDLEVCNFKKTLAVVGSRRATTAAKDILSTIISQFSNTDICIVSGLAAGIDTTAHLSALNNGLKTIGVIASGHDYIYPASNRELYKRIEDGNGIVLSEYYPSFEPVKFHFPQRNRIVTGLSYGTLVVEASLKSGALISANLCLEQGRELMCMPGLISNPNTEGIYKLLKNGATLITCADDILNALNWEVKIEYEQKKLNFDELSPEQIKVLKCLELESKTFDEILYETNLDFSDLLVTLTNLEMFNFIKQENNIYKIR